jgi:hypothetical protein
VSERDLEGAIARRLFLGHEDEPALGAERKARDDRVGPELGLNLGRPFQCAWK